jgi:hypothetical protein
LKSKGSDTADQNLAVAQIACGLADELAPSAMGHSTSCRTAWNHFFVDPAVYKNTGFKINSLNYY